VRVGALVVVTREPSVGVAATPDDPMGDAVTVRPVGAAGTRGLSGPLGLRDATCRDESCRGRLRTAADAGRRAPDCSGAKDDHECADEQSGQDAAASPAGPVIARLGVLGQRARRRSVPAKGTAAARTGTAVVVKGGALAFPLRTMSRSAAVCGRTIGSFARSQPTVARAASGSRLKSGGVRR